MELKDLSVSLERLDDVRGGSATSNVTQVAAQLGFNTAAGSSSAFGLDNQSSSLVGQYAPQSISQEASVVTVDRDRDVLSIADSVLFGAFLR